MRFKVLGCEEGQGLSPLSFVMAKWLNRTSFEVGMPLKKLKK